MTVEGFLSGSLSGEEKLLPMLGSSGGWWGASLFTATVQMMKEEQSSSTILYRHSVWDLCVCFMSK